MTAPAPGALLGDGAALREILALAGPEMGARILRQVVTDLSVVQAALVPALAAVPPDWAAIRTQTHVLISVAGTIGAARLHTLAIALNGLAHGMDAAAATATAPPLLADLAGVVALLQGRADDGNGAAA